jgi:hypothetical protein
VWSVKHHFTDYTMVPNVVQFLSYMHTPRHTRRRRAGPPGRGSRRG